MRHAYPADLTPAQGEGIIAICGEPTVIGEHDPRREGPFPECDDCDRVWRQVERYLVVYDRISPS